MSFQDVDLFLVVIFAVGFIVPFYSFFKLSSLRHNVDAAKSTGLNYVIVPFFIFGIPWAIAEPLLVPLFELLPDRWTERWLPSVAPIMSGHAPH